MNFINFPSTCTLVFHYTHLFLHLYYPQRNECPYSFPRQVTCWSMLALQTSSALSFLEPSFISYSLFYLSSLPYSQPKYKLQAPLHTKNIPSWTNVYKHRHVHSPLGAPTSQLLLFPHPWHLDLDFRTLLTTKWVSNCQIQSPLSICILPDHTMAFRQTDSFSLFTTWVIWQVA